MNKLKLTCNSAEMGFATDSKMVYNYFLNDKEQLPETIPGIQVTPDDKIRLDKNCIMYLNRDDKTVQIDPEINKVILSVPEKQLYLPDLVYLALSMIAKELNKDNKYIVHAAAIEKDDNATLILGETGSGKTTLALWHCIKNNSNFLSNDRTVLGMKDGEPFIFNGTKQTHVRLGVIHEYFPTLKNKIDTQKLANPWSNKIYINPEFEDLGIKVSNTAKLKNIIVASTYPTANEKTTLERQPEDVAKLSMMRFVSDNIRAYQNIVLSTDDPFPSFDNQELAEKRVKFVKDVVSQTPIYTARGNIDELSLRITEIEK